MMRRVLLVLVMVSALVGVTTAAAAPWEQGWGRLAMKAYRSQDQCLNIKGVQKTVPMGYYQDASRNCYLSPTPTPTETTTTSTPTPSTSTEAAVLHNWGTPFAGDEFNYTGSPDPLKWSLYNSAGHAGNGLRVPEAWSVDGSAARVSGDSAGTTGGMSARFAKRTYGRWEARMRTSVRDPEYHPVMLLWPSGAFADLNQQWEIDYAEGTADTTKMRFYLHNCCTTVSSASAVVDSTQWHNYAVSWTQTGVIGYLDGVEWFRDTNPDNIPFGNMKQTLQLDWFPDGTATTPSWMEVDWVRIYYP